jgi:hypothetical protein
MGTSKYVLENPGRVLLRAHREVTLPAGEVWGEGLSSHARRGREDAHQSRDHEIRSRIAISSRAWTSVAEARSHLRPRRQRPHANLWTSGRSRAVRSGRRSASGGPQRRPKCSAARSTEELTVPFADSPSRVRSKPRRRLGNARWFRSCSHDTPWEHVSVRPGLPVLP